METFTIILLFPERVSLDSPPELSISLSVLHCIAEDKWKPKVCLMKDSTQVAAEKLPLVSNTSQSWEP